MKNHQMNKKDCFVPLRNTVQEDCGLSTTEPEYAILLDSLRWLSFRIVYILGNTANSSGFGGAIIFYT